MRPFYPLAWLAMATFAAAADPEEFWSGAMKNDADFMDGADFEKIMEEDGEFDPTGKKPSTKIEDQEEANVEYLTKPFTLPEAPQHALLWTTFQDPSLPGWKKLSDTEKFTGEFKVTLRDNNWLEGDTGMQLTTQSAYHGMARQLAKQFDAQKFDALYASMEVQYEKPVGCGGAYFKLFQIPSGKDASIMSDQTPYSIMFGPDKCGHLTNKVHMIVKYPHPKRENEYIEDHMSGVPRVPEGTESHQYGFEVHKDGTMKLYIDHKVEIEGDMKTLFRQPAFEDLKEIEDPQDEKPDDWVDAQKIPDPDAVKPENWDEDAPEEILDRDAVKPEGWLDSEPLMVPNPEAEKPSDWDDDEDGEWKAPLVKNPACYIGCGEWTRPMKRNPDYKGKWAPPMIDNPDYKGEWAPRKIENPDYYNFEKPYGAIQTFNAVGFELWTVDAGAIIDNLIITTNGPEYHKFIDQTWKVKNEIESTNTERKRAAEKVAKEKRESKAKAAADAATGSSTFFGMWKNIAQQSMTTLILTVTLPVATTLWVVSKVIKRRATVATIPGSEVAAAKKKDDDIDQPGTNAPTQEGAPVKGGANAVSPAEKKPKKGSQKEGESVPTSAGVEADRQPRLRRKQSAGDKGDEDSE